MINTKFVKAFCEKTGKHFAVEVQKYGTHWEVVNVDELDAESASVSLSEVSQERFATHSNLLACPTCGSRLIGGCRCAKSKRCPTGYSFNCAYCEHFKIDYSLPSRAALARLGNKITTSQGIELKFVSFSNVQWNKFDNIRSHVNGRLSGYPHEPHHHVIAKESDIEFHGYNISAMDEGVYYDIDTNDTFDIECDVDTSGIKPHPGGCLYINFGLIQAMINQEGGEFILGGKPCCKVGSRFKMRLSLTSDGMFTVYINGQRKNGIKGTTQTRTRIIFGFKHDSHNCDLLSHATLKNIMMIHGTTR